MFSSTDASGYGGYSGKRDSCEKSSCLTSPSGFTLSIVGFAHFAFARHCHVLELRCSNGWCGVTPSAQKFINHCVCVSGAFPGFEPLPAAQEAVTLQRRHLLNCYTSFHHKMNLNIHVPSESHTSRGNKELYLDIPDGTVC